MKQNPVRAFAIDLDGTLVDSAPDLHAAVCHMQQALGDNLCSEADVRLWVGNGIEKLVHRALCHDMDGVAPAERFNPALAEFKRAYAECNGQHSRLFPGVREGLELLRARGLPLVMVTNKAGEFARPLLQALNIDHYFAGSVAGDEVAEKKPHPEALLRAADMVAVPAAECAMLGDSISDIKAAHNAGFHSIVVSYGYNHGVPVRELTAEAEPHRIIDSLEELGGVLDDLSSGAG